MSLRCTQNHEKMWRAGLRAAYAKLIQYRVALKEPFFVAAGFSLRLHRRDACATGLTAT